MERSQVFDSSQSAAASPSGTYIASLTQQNLCVQHSLSLSPAFTFPLDPPTTTKQSLVAISSLSWSADSRWLLLHHSEGVLVFSLDEPERRVRIANGSGSLGRIIAAEVVAGDSHAQVMTVWEFGRVKVWDLSTGRATELGDVKTGIKGNAWSIRRVAGSPLGTVKIIESLSSSQTDVDIVKVLLTRQHAQDVLHFYLPPNQTPFRIIPLSTVDAQSLSISRCGNWLGILDSSLSSEQLHVYTIEGFPYRTYPAKGQSSSSARHKPVENSISLGFKSMAWSKDEIVLTMAQSMSFLSTRTFSLQHFLPLSEIKIAQTALVDGVFALQEMIDASGQRSYATLTGQMIRVPNPRTSIHDLRLSSSGDYIVCRDESDATIAYVVDASHRRIRSVLMQRSTIRKLVWHPSLTSLVLVTCDDGQVYVWDVASDSPPERLTHDVRPHDSTAATSIGARWLALGPGDSDEDKLAVLVTSHRAGYQVLWPRGRPNAGVERLLTLDNVAVSRGGTNDTDGDVSQDSLYDILTGKTPLPELKVQKIEAEAAIEETVGLEDTFRVRATQHGRTEAEGGVGVGIDDAGRQLYGTEEDSEIF